MCVRRGSGARVFLFPPLGCGRAISKPTDPSGGVFPDSEENSAARPGLSQRDKSGYCKTGEADATAAPLTGPLTEHVCQSGP